MKFKHLPPIFIALCGLGMMLNTGNEFWLMTGLIVAGLIVCTIEIIKNVRHDD